MVTNLRIFRMPSYHCEYSGIGSNKTQIYYLFPILR